ncbi:hypothetical protein KNO15_21085 [Leifsonia shinshuensis]|nr:hypothetical protein [Leifsonia shinshuensis]MCI0159204.1 hypothetical protein [Leifsonia shinshuensis]
MNAEDVVFTDPEGTATGQDPLAAKADDLQRDLPEALAFREDGPRYEGA